MGTLDDFTPARRLQLARVLETLREDLMRETVLSRWHPDFVAATFPQKMNALDNANAWLALAIVSKERGFHSIALGVPTREDAIGLFTETIEKLSYPFLVEEK